MSERNRITVVTPSLPERDGFLRECVSSVERAGIPHMVVIDSNKEGPAIIRNRAMEEVDSEFALFLDDDDLLEPNYYDLVSPYLDDHDIIYTWCKREGFDAPFDRDFSAADLMEANYIPVTACVRKSIFDQVGGFPVGVAYEDWALWLKFVGIEARWKCVHEYGWTYRRHAGSRTHENQALVSQGKVPAA